MEAERYNSDSKDIYRVPNTLSIEISLSLSLYVSESPLFKCIFAR